MFGAMLTTAFALMLAYAVWRASSVPFLARRIPRRAFMPAGLLLLAFFLAGRFIGHGSSGTAVVLLELSSLSGMVLLFLVSVCLLVVDILTLFGRLFAHRAPFLRSCALVAGLALSVIALVQGMRPPTVTDYEVRLEGLPADADGTVIAAMSDIHLGSILGEKWFNARVNQVMEFKPDIIVLLGDIVEGHGAPDERLLGSFRRLSAPLGLWCVTGNHEYHGGSGDTVDFFERAGFRVLRDSWALARPGLVIAGVDDLTTRRRSGGNADPVGHALAGRPQGGTVLLSHSPLMLERAAGAGAGLVLSGHTHGGQVWPFGYFVRTLYPAVSGLNLAGNMPVIVCRGTGTWGPRMRLWRRAEILRITLRSPILK
jgi:predicted MPP superfamily phosphohydrolase